MTVDKSSAFLSQLPLRAKTPYPEVNATAAELPSTQDCGCDLIVFSQAEGSLHKSPAIVHGDERHRLRFLGNNENDRYLEKLSLFLPQVVSPITT